MTSCRFLTLVLVAGAAFGTHRCFQSQFGIRLPWISSGPGTVPGRVNEPLTPEVVNSRAEELLELVDRGEKVAASQQAIALLAQVDATYADGERDTRGDNTESPSLQIAVLLAKYAGAKADPARFAIPFQQFADRLIADRPNSGEAAQAALLKVLVGHDFQRPVTPDVLQDLQAYTATHSPSQGAMLVSLVAQELARNRLAESAKDVLRFGIRTYQSTSAVAGLVNQLADLDHRQVNASRTGANSFRAHMRAAQSKATARASSSDATSPPVRRR